MITEQKSTQQRVLLNHFKTNETITSIEASSKYGITRLSNRISELEDKGYIFTRQTIWKKNQYGINTHYMIYRMVN